jgi:hypothetical protein
LALTVTIAAGVAAPHQNHQDVQREEVRDLTSNYRAPKLPVVSIGTTVG